MQSLFARTVRSSVRARVGLAFALAVGAVAILALAAGAQAKSRGTKVKVMTRNLYLGADLRPGIDAGSIQGVVDFAGEALHQEAENNFRVRSKGLAKEILKKKPDLVGLQEAAVYRDAPCSDNPFPPSATHIRSGEDHLKLLMKRLNAGEKHYRVVIKEPEFDFQVWANTDGNQGTGSPFGCEIEPRLTFSDVILARKHAGVRTKNARRGHFQTLLEFDPCACGVTVDVRRGWTRVDAKVRDSRRFRFVETHLEAYDDTTSNHTNQGTDVGRGEVRAAQAKELIGPGGPTSGKLPVVLALDVNSLKPPPLPGDELAYQAFLDAGWKRRSTNNPASCCIDADVLKVGAGGSVSDFDHVIDRVLTDAPRRVRLIRSSVTGRRPVNGFWDSDHAGVFSALRVP